LTGAATGAGGLAAVFGAYKLAKVLLTKNRKEVSKPDKSTVSDDPFQRRMDEARQHRELREYTERRSPEYDAAVGRVISDELELSKQLGTKDEQTVIKDFMERVRCRVDKLCPPSTREYIQE
jgi:hypothetical protein